MYPSASKVWSSRREVARVMPARRATSDSVSDAASDENARSTARPRSRDCTKGPPRFAGAAPADPAGGDGRDAALGSALDTAGTSVHDVLIAHGCAQYERRDECEDGHRAKGGRPAGAGPQT